MSGPGACFAIAAAVLAVSGAAAAVLRRRRIAAGVVNLVLLTVAGLFVLIPAVNVLEGSGPSDFALKVGGFNVPFVMDGFSALFLILLVVLAWASTLFSIRFVAGLGPGEGKGYYVAFPFFILGMIGLLVVDDLGAGFTAAWQVMAVSSFFLVRSGPPGRSGSRAALKYLAFMEGAWLLIVAAPLFIRGYVPGDSLASIGGRVAASGGGVPAIIFFAFLFAGFGLKSGVFPLGRLWIPDAYSQAPAPAAALLAGILEKTGIFGLARIFLFTASEAGPAFDPRLWGMVFLALGTLTLFIGTVQAIKQSDYFRLLAFSSIGQVGYIIFALGACLLSAGSYLGPVILIGAVYHALNHGVFKGALFLTAGGMQHATGTRDLNRLGGLLKFMPLTGAAAAILSYAISGMPASSGFMSKWLMISGGLLAGRHSLALTVCSIAALFTSALTLACYVKFFGLAFTSAGAEWRIKKKISEVPMSMLLPQFILIVVCLAQAFAPSFFIGLISRALARSGSFLFSAAFSGGGSGAASAGPLAVKVAVPGGGALLAVASPLIIAGLVLAFILLAAFLRRSGGSRPTEAPTWLCGYQDLNSDNSYLDRSMFGDLKKALRWTGGEPVDGNGDGHE